MKRQLLMSRTGKVALAMVLAMGPFAAHAQQLEYDAPLDDEAIAVDDGSGVPAEGARRSQDRAERVSSRPRISVDPYVEAQQIIVADLKNDTGVDLATRVGAGVTASIATRRAEGQLGLNYSHDFGWGDYGDADTVNGLARGRYTLIPRQLSIEAGGIATRTRSDSRFVGPGTFLGDRSNTSKLYSIYAGPSYSTRIGPLTAGAVYRFGYTRVDQEYPLLLPSGVSSLGGFQESSNHSASASVGMQPGALPVGWSLSIGYDREDADPLDQRFENKYARLDLTYPVSPTLALVGGVGYEDVEISQRAPLRDAAGAPVIGSNGTYVTDPASARQLAFNTDGLIWDVGVMWRPGPRTSLSARVGERYGDTFYSANLAYRANRNTSLHLAIYTGLTSFGRSLSGGLASLPTEFNMIRNPFDGSYGACGIGLEGSACLNGVMSGVTSSNFRNRGVLASLASRAMGWNVGLGFGVDQREYITPLLAPQLNGITDETYFVNLTANRRLDALSSVSGSVYGTLYDNGIPGVADVVNLGAMAAYDRVIWRRLTGQAAVNLNSFRQEGVDSGLVGAALLGLRYGF